MDYTKNELDLFEIALTYGNTQDIRDLIARFGKEKCDAMFDYLTKKEN